MYELNTIDTCCGNYILSICDKSRITKVISLKYLPYISNCNAHLADINCKQALINLNDLNTIFKG